MTRQRIGVQADFLSKCWQFEGLNISVIGVRGLGLMVQVWRISIIRFLLELLEARLLGIIKLFGGLILGVPWLHGFLVESIVIGAGDRISVLLFCRCKNRVKHIHRSDRRKNILVVAELSRGRWLLERLLVVFGMLPFLDRETAGCLEEWRNRVFAHLLHSYLERRASSETGVIELLLGTPISVGAGLDRISLVVDFF